MFSPVVRRNIGRMLPFGIIWLLTGWVFLIIEYAAAEQPGQVPNMAIQVSPRIFLFASLSVFTLGIIVGSIELLFLDRLLDRLRFWQKLLSKLLIYYSLFFLTILITFPIAASLELSTNVKDDRVWQRYGQFVGSIPFISTMLQMGVSLLLSLFFAEISANIGHRALLNFFTGHYHQPVEEERIFLFLDMRGSTTLAERMGNTAFFKLLRTYYADLADAIIQYEGEVYQYVGDEIIVSWRATNLVNYGGSLACFQAMQWDLAQRADWYQQHFGVVPTAKAGLHAGPVTTGEIGTLKKEIFFTGDVLNTTARIQGLCNQHGVDILLSDKIVQHLTVAQREQIQPLGRVDLRGRREPLTVYTLLTDDEGTRE